MFLHAIAQRWVSHSSPLAKTYHSDAREPYGVHILIEPGNAACSSRFGSVADTGNQFLPTVGRDAASVPLYAFDEETQCPIAVCDSRASVWAPGRRV